MKRAVALIAGGLALCATIGAYVARKADEALRR